jgi:argininosuccinate lyase
MSSLSEKFTFSIGYDHVLAGYDCSSSIAHAEMLGAKGIIPKKDAAAIVRGLTKISGDIDSGRFKYDPASEDIHTDIQAKLKKLIGAPADRLHTARSRNDQVVTDLRLYCLDRLGSIMALIDGLQISIVRFAEKNQDVIIPGYTHLQSAQVVLLSHHMLAYVEMLERDKGRFEDALQRIGMNPLGACALSGTTLPTDRQMVSRKLGFQSTSPNSIDAVSDRDFVIEVLSDIAITGMHLSRICEDLIIWVTSEFGFVSLDDAFCTGSSIMPHKKNPDVLELVRGASSRFSGRLVELLALMKGLPLTYNRDMQMDKPALFDSISSIEDMLALMAELFSGIRVNHDRLKGRIKDESFFSVDILDYLVKKGASYREAHDTVGRMVKECLDRGRRIKDLTLGELRAFSPRFGLDVKRLLDPGVSVNGKKSFGSTNPAMVRSRIVFWKRRLK